MKLIITILIFLIMWSLLVQYAGSNDVLKIKDQRTKKNKWMSYIPIYGHFYVKKLAYLDKDYSDHEYGYLFTKEMVLKRIGIMGIILILALALVIPISIIFFVSFTNNALRTLVIAFGLIILLILNQGLTSDYAKSLGYEGFKYDLIGIVPIASFFIINKICPSKKKHNDSRKLKSVFTFKNIASRILLQGQVALVAVIVIVPVIYIFGMAFSDIRSGIPNKIWPEEPTFNAFRRLFLETNFKLWYWNTLKIALINMLVGTVLITGAAYVFARFSFKGKKAGLLTIMVLQAFPSFMGLLAMYVLFWKFGLLGKPTALSILYIGGSIPGNIWLIKGFLDQIPKELDESAEIDGASKLKIFVSIILPLSVPILTFVAVSMFMGPWMDYMLPGYLLNHRPVGAGPNYDITQQWTLAVGIFDFIQDATKADYSAFAAAALIVGIPISILYMVFQKYLIEGIMAGATKG